MMNEPTQRRRSSPGVGVTRRALGSSDPVPFKRTRKGLELKLPEGLAGGIAVALKIRGTGLA